MSESKKLEEIEHRYGLNDNMGVGHPIIEEDLQNDISFLLKKYNEKKNSKSDLIYQIKHLLDSSFEDLAELKLAIKEVLPVHEVASVKTSLSEFPQGEYQYAFSRELLLENPEVLERFEGESILISENFLNRIDEDKSLMNETGYKSRELNSALYKVHESKRLVYAPSNKNKQDETDPIEAAIDNGLLKYPKNVYLDLRGYTKFNEGTDKPVVFVVNKSTFTDTDARRLGISILVLSEDVAKNG